MKVRARVKAPEHLPEWDCKCKGTLELYKKMGEFVVDIDKLEESPANTCVFCHQLLPAYTAAYIVNGDYAGCVFGLSLLDIDEGPLEAQ